MKIQDSISTDDPIKFRARCGTAYVSKIKAGGHLFAAVTFTFFDANAKIDFSNKFDAQATTGAASGAIQGTLTAMIEQASDKTSMKIEFNQKGGKPAALGQAFPRGSDAITCSLANRDQCKALISNIFDYATGVFPGDVDDRPVVVGYDTSNFLGINFDPLPGSVQQARQDTVDALMTLDKDRRKVLNLLMSSIGYGTDARKQELLKVRDTIEANLRILQANLVHCVERADDSCRAVSALSLTKYPAESLVPTGVSVMTGVVGGTGGLPVIQRCSDFVTGLWGESGVILDLAGTVCQGGHHFALLGSGQASSFSVQCPQDWVLTGVRAHRETWRRTNLVGNLILECSFLPSLKAGEPTQSRDLAVFSPEQPTEMMARCETGQAAIAVHYRAGTKIDAISLECIRAY